MSHERIEWKKAQTKGLRKLIESAKSINELSIKHPDNNFLLEDLIEVMNGKGPGDPLSAKEQLDLLRLSDLLKWCATSQQFMLYLQHSKNSVEDTP